MTFSGGSAVGSEGKQCGLASIDIDTGATDLRRKLDDVRVESGLDLTNRQFEKRLANNRYALLLLTAACGTRIIEINLVDRYRFEF